MKHLHKQPILYMLVLGMLLFFVYSNITAFYDAKNREIVVNANQVEMISESFSKTWNRSPTETELEGLINNLVKEEVYFREALALGLDKSDPAVKRRLRQMMELMLDDNVQLYPSEDQLREYMNENPDKFLSNATISFQQVYFKPEREEAAKNALQGLLKRGLEDREIGDAIMIPRDFQNETNHGVRSIFGDDFTTAIFDLQEGDWQGPLQSAFGWHLVKIRELSKAQLPDLNDVWDEVEREWSFERKQQLKEDQYLEIRDRYLITVERPG